MVRSSNISFMSAGPLIPGKSFVTPLSPRVASCALSRLQHRRKRGMLRMVVDPGVAGTGYALLDVLKGVVIGPSVNELMAAVCGGTVGVMGTIMILEVRRQHVKEHKQCPYCHGVGKLPCGACYSMGTVPSPNANASQEPCKTCSESGYLECNHVRSFCDFLHFLLTNFENPSLSDQCPCPRFRCRCS